MKEIIVENYNSDWADIFKKLKQVYLNRLGNLNVDIQHVGSTSVPGLAAKPIIDIDIIVKNQEDINIVIQNLEKIGYIHVGDLGIKGREAFKRKSNEVPYKEGISSWNDHHLYVCMSGCASVENHLSLRNYLKENPQAIIEYGNLKKDLAEKYKYDINSYIKKKTDFIVKILEKTCISKNDINDIINVNKNNSN